MTRLGASLPKNRNKASASLKNLKLDKVPEKEEFVN
jgi:hypothetical protein